MHINISDLYSLTGQAKLSMIEEYIQQVHTMVPAGADVTLSGPGPVWLYLKIAHALHGRVRILTYESPVTGPVEIFNHNPR